MLSSLILLILFPFPSFLYTIWKYVQTWHDCHSSYDSLFYAHCYRILIDIPNMSCSILNQYASSYHAIKYFIHIVFSMVSLMPYYFPFGSRYLTFSDYQLLRHLYLSSELYFLNECCLEKGFITKYFEDCIVSNLNSATKMGLSFFISAGLP